MELRQLRYFVAVAQELHFGRAAQRLQMTQQPLSRQIQALESELGVRLFERTKRRVRLTSAGQLFLEEACKVLGQTEQAIQTAQKAERGELGRLVVGFNGFAIESLLPDVIRVFCARYPEVNLNLREMTTTDQVKAMQAEQIQLGFIMPPIVTDSLRCEFILQEPLVVLLSETHRLAPEPEVSLQALQDDAFVLVPQQWEPGLRHQYIHLCEQNGFAPRVVLEASQKPTILGLVAAGIGVSLAPASLGRNIHRRGVVYRSIKPPIVEVQLVAIQRQE